MEHTHTTCMEDNLVYASFCLLPLAATAGLYLFFHRYQQHRIRPPRWWRLLLGNGLVLFFGSALLGFLGESYFRFWYDTTDSFALTKISQRWFQRYYHRNNLGLRDDLDYALARSPGKPRITFIGDSFTEGHGVRDVNDRFANRVRRLHPEWEVQVFAQPGIDSGQELALLAQLADSNYPFDRVVLVYCLNDLDDVIPAWIERYKFINHRLRRQRPSFLFEHSYLLNWLYYRAWMITLPEIRDYYRSDREAYDGPPWEAHTPRLGAMRDLVRDKGGQLYVVTFPYLHLIGPAYEFRDVHRKLDRFWHSLGVPHLDLLPVYEPYPPRKLTVNAYDAHPNEFSHALAAEAISRFLKQQIDANGNY